MLIDVLLVAVLIDVDVGCNDRMDAVEDAAVVWLGCSLDVLVDDGGGTDDDVGDGVDDAAVAWLTCSLVAVLVAAVVAGTCIPNARARCCCSVVIGAWNNPPNKTCGSRRITGGLVLEAVLFSSSGARVVLVWELVVLVGVSASCL